jgi:hypothetical protein
VRDEKGEIFDAVVIGLPRRHGVRRGRGFKTYGKEDDLAVGIRFGKFERVEWRINNSDVGAFGLHVEQALRGSRDAQHVAERAEDCLRSLRDRHGLIDQFDGRHANRAARAVDQRDLTGQQVFEPALDDGVGLPAADFHDGPGASHSFADGVRELSGGLLVAVFTEEFHRVPPSPRPFLPGP